MSVGTYTKRFIHNHESFVYIQAKDALKITFNTSSIKVTHPADPLEFPRNRLTLMEELGCGAFGTVYKTEAIGFNHGESKMVAVKKLKGM